MIDEVDAALGRLLKSELGRKVEVSFAPPAAAWEKGERKTPLLDVHLFEVREDESLRRGGLELTPPANEGASSTRKPAPRWFRLSYWVSAWGPDAETEHGLLGAALAALARYEALPVSVLSGGLETLGLPVRLAVAVPPAGDAHVATLWASLGVPMRGAIELAVTAPLEVPAAVEAGPPVVERRLRFGPPRPPPAAGQQVPPAMPGPPPPPTPLPGAPAPAGGPKPPSEPPKPPEPPPPLEEIVISPDPGEPPRVH